MGNKHRETLGEITPVRVRVVKPYQSLTVGDERIGPLTPDKELILARWKADVLVAEGIVERVLPTLAEIRTYTRVEERSDTLQPLPENLYGDALHLASKEESHRRKEIVAEVLALGRLRLEKIVKMALYGEEKPDNMVYQERILYNKLRQTLVEWQRNNLMLNEKMGQ
ncbi:MAG: hypothetical protein DRO11_04990 [Methanobacteriota archaeon]|nr:MAG: hypothetical protein DRO11_04990 [Euryarchaeota archaeon]